METVHNKLVRDKIPMILEMQGRFCKTKKVDSYRKALLLKLQEEVLEVAASENKQQQLEELADVLEVIHALLREQDTYFTELETLRLAKRQEKGGFDEGIFLETTCACLFCLKAKDSVIAHFTHCFVIFDEHPVSKGHLLIIPYTHYGDWFQAPKKVQLEIIEILNTMKRKLDAEYKPQGYNIGMNCGEVAGQSIMHLHVHLIPRYPGDMPDPKGGVRGVIPEKQKY